MSSDDNLEVIDGTTRSAVAAEAANYIFAYRRNDRRGDTRTKGRVRVWDTGSQIRIKLQLNVRKTGMSGTGKGALAFQLLDANFDPLIQKPKGLTVGAKVPEGVNEKDWEKVYAVTGALAKRIRRDGLILAASISTEYDRIGIPRNVNEWTTAVNDVAPILALGSGESLTKKGWFFMKKIV